MSYTNGLDKPTDYFNTVKYSGNGGSQNITGVGFNPDWIWTKCRSNAETHELYDKVRGAGKRLRSDNTDAENTESYQSFVTDGFAWSQAGNQNASGRTYVAWNWLAGNGSSSSNTDGSITSTVSANTTAGFSIVSYTGTGSGNPTVGHGLGAVPKMIILKPRSLSSSNWSVYHSSLGASKVTRLNNTGASFTGTAWNSTDPTSSVFTITTDYDTNQSSATYIAYCFAEKKGYSKFGSYTGNGNADGTFVYTGFKPAWVMIKNADASESWLLMDNKRPTAGNPNDKGLFANSSSAEETGVNRLDFLSNGFKQRINAGTNNQSGINYIYMAFADNPFVTSTGIPTTAR